MTITNFFTNNNWKIVSEQVLPEKAGEFSDIDNLNLNKQTREFLNMVYPDGIYQHQKKALELYKKDRNVALCTSTSSGKSLVFQVAAMEEIFNNPESTILAIYPMKALGSEQEKRWLDTFKTAGININVGRINGGVDNRERERIIKNCRLVIVTPDVLHSWFLGNALKEKYILKFLQNLSLLILDEAHSYSGVFGSHSSLLFTRLNHIKCELGTKMKYIAASATIKKPECHLNKLLGVSFDIIGQKFESSPKRKVNIYMVDVPGDKEFYSSVGELLNTLAREENERFIAFVDSRMMTEKLSIIANRENLKEDEQPMLRISPYRSGYETEDRDKIQRDLSNGDLKGVISTSALEMGLDISGLTTVVLFGVPYSATSFWQRIGRVGRNSPGKVIIVNDGSPNSKRIFNNPGNLLNLSLSESALYLGNPVINYIHALCLARNGGEHDIVTRFTGNYQEEFSSKCRSVVHNDIFRTSCENERYGQISAVFQLIKGASGEIPNLDYPLREIEKQYRIIYKKGLLSQELGTIAKNQIMREAYPGAVYYHNQRAYRVFKINESSHEVLVRDEKYYFTKPSLLPQKVYPNLIPSQIQYHSKSGNTLMIESELQIQERIYGYKETRGNTEHEEKYPNQHYNRDFYNRYNFTTGVLIYHPEFNQLEPTEIEKLAEVLFEAFMMTIPFDRNDINYATDRYVPRDNSFLNAGDRFICIYDQAYKSLHLTGRITREGVFEEMLCKTLEILENNTFDNEQTVKPDTALNLTALVQSIIEDFKKSKLKYDIVPEEKQGMKMLKDGTIGIDILNNQEVEIIRFFYKPLENRFYYEIKPVKANMKLYLPVDCVQEIPGISETGYYDENTGLVA